MAIKTNPLQGLIDIIVVAIAFGGAYYLGKSVEFAYTGPAATVTAIIVISVLLALRGTGWGALGLKFPKKIISVLGAFALAAVIVAVTAGFVLAVMPMLESYLGQQVHSDRFSNLAGDLRAYLFVVIVIAWGGAAFGEEMLFRGFLMPRIAEFAGGGAAAWIAALLLQAVIFGLLHYSQGPYGIVQSGLIGLIMGVFYLIARRNLWPVILAHGAIDTISLTQTYLGAG